MSAWVSPPQCSTSHMVAVAASMAQAASTALPPCWQVRAPAAAPRGVPVMATQCWPCSTGLLGRDSAAGTAAGPAASRSATKSAALTRLLSGPGPERPGPLLGLEGDVLQDLERVACQPVAEVHHVRVEVAGDHLHQELEDHHQPDDPEQEVEDDTVDDDEQPANPG